MAAIPPVAAPAPAPAPAAPTRAGGNGGNPVAAPAPAPAAPTRAGGNGGNGNAATRPAGNGNVNGQPAATAPVNNAQTQPAAGTAAANTNPAANQPGATALPSSALPSSAGPVLPAASQTIPNYVPASSSGNTSSANSSGGSSLPTGAVAAIAVIAALIGLFALWRIFVFVRGRRQKRATAAALSTSESKTGMMTSLGRTATSSSTAWLAGGGGSSTPGTLKGGSSYYGYHAAQSSGGPPSPAISGAQSFTPPITPWAPVDPANSANSISGASPRASRLHIDPTLTRASESGRSSPSSLHPSHHLRDPSTRSVASVAAAARRSMYQQGYSPSPAYSTMGPGQRTSILPHSPHSRVEIVPPQPLSRPSTVVAVDRQTLAFSSLSGMTGDADWFGGSDQDKAERLSPAYSADQPFLAQQQQQRDESPHSTQRLMQQAAARRPFSGDSSSHHADPELETLNSRPSLQYMNHAIGEDNALDRTGPSSTLYDPPTTRSGTESLTDFDTSRVSIGDADQGLASQTGTESRRANHHERTRSRDAAARLSEGGTEGSQGVQVQQVESPLDQLRISLRGMVDQ